MIDRVAQEVFEETKTKVSLPRRDHDRGAARGADRRTDRRSPPTSSRFGTNDLTQMTFGVSRDDAEGKFLLRYVEDKVLPRNPFETLDRDGVGRLMRFAVEEGRAVRPSLSVGICGEHGGDTDSSRSARNWGSTTSPAHPFGFPPPAWRRRMPVWRGWSGTARR